MNKYLILNFSKKVGHTRTRTPHPEKTVRGNLVLTVREDFISRFNVPMFKEEIPIIHKVKGSTYRKKTGTLTTLPEFYRSAKKRKGEKLIEIRKLKANAPTLLGQFTFERHYLRFPAFFNQWMIDNALNEIIGAAPDIEKLRFTLSLIHI